MEEFVNSNGVGEAGDVAGGIGVVVGIAICVSVATALIVDMAVSITSVGLAVGADMKLLQDASITGARNKEINVLPNIFIFQLPLMFCEETPNDVRYPRVGGIELHNWTCSQHSSWLSVHIPSDGAFCIHLVHEHF